MSEEKTPEDLSPESEGLPEITGGPPPRGPKEAADEGVPLPGDSPMGLDGRLAAREQREGQSLEERLEEETDRDSGVVPRRAGRLVGPGDEVDELDKTAEEVAEDTEESRGGLTAEEAAIRLERER